MTFATFAKEQIKEINAKSIKELELKQLKDTKHITFYNNFSNLIKDSILGIQNKSLPLKTNKKGHFFICSNEKIDNHYSYDTKSIHGVDFFEHLSTFIPTDMFFELDYFLLKQGIKQLLLKYQWDAGGVKSWNEVYAVI